MVEQLLRGGLPEGRLYSLEQIQDELQSTIREELVTLLGQLIELLRTPDLDSGHAPCFQVSLFLKADAVLLNPHVAHVQQLG